MFFGSYDQTHAKKKLRKRQHDFYQLNEWIGNLFFNLLNHGVIMVSREKIFY